MKTEFDLLDRLVHFSVSIIRLVETLPSTKAANHIGGQILRSGTSPAPNYAEAQSAESSDDFIHKLKIALKELRETEVWLKVIRMSGLLDAPPEKLDRLLQENHELIAILFTCIATAKRNAIKK